MSLISLEAAIAIGEGSKRTWWRRISDNPTLKKGSDSRGRTMLSLDAASAFITIPDEAGAVELIMAADAGDADAQNDAGLMFSELGNHQAAIYWWRISSEQGHVDAMHHLGRCYTDGVGVPTDENVGIMWIAKAASQGHIIAKAQMKGLRPFR